MKPVEEPKYKNIVCEILQKLAVLFNSSNIEKPSLLDNFLNAKITSQVQENITRTALAEKVQS